MGLTRAAGRRLLVLESLPQAVSAALGGALTGWATIRLLAPGIDLTAIALPSARPSPVGAQLRTDALSLAVPGAAVLLLAVGWGSDRRGGRGDGDRSGNSGRGTRDEALCRRTPPEPARGRDIAWT